MKTNLLKFRNGVIGFCVVAGSITQLNAQTVNFEWAKRMGNTGTDQSASVAIDASGNVYTIGCFNGIVDFDPGAGVYDLTSAGFNDIFISKLDAAGNFVWAREFGGSAYNDCGFSIAVDGAGNVYATGSFNGTVDFDPDTGIFNMTSMNSWDVFVSKFDSSGNFVWVKQARSFNGEGYSMTIDESGNIYLLGRFNGPGYFDAITIYPDPAVTDPIFICKLDSSGNFLWAKPTGGSWVSYNTYDHSIAVHDGHVYITGDFSNTTDFDPGVDTTYLTSFGGRDIYIAKYDTSGNFLWAKNIGGPYDDQGYSIAIDNTEHIYTTGSFAGIVDFDPGAGTFNLTGAGQRDIFISKLDSSGSFVWAKRIGGVGQEEGESIALDGSANIYTTGYFQAIVDFDPGTGTSSLTSSGGFDIFVLKLDSSGNFGWVKKMGGASTDNANSIVLDHSNNVYTTGFFYGTADFDPGAGTYNLTDAGNGDIFVHKMSQSPVGISENFRRNDIRIFPNPATDRLTIVLANNLKQITVTITDVTGEIIYTTTSAEAQKIEVSTKDFAEGVYVVQIQTAEFMETNKLILAR